MSAQPLFVGITCSSTRHPAVGRFVADGEGHWWLVGASRQRPGSSAQGLGSAASVTGGVGTAAEYEGCPSCRADSLVLCGQCRTLSCFDESWEVFACPCCDNSGAVTRNGIEGLSALGQA